MKITKIRSVDRDLTLKRLKMVLFREASARESEWIVLLTFGIRRK